MIHNDILNQLQLLIKTSAPPLIEVAQNVVSAPQWTPGQRLPAHVLASLPNGRFEVKVGDEVLDLNLPRNTQPGDKLNLTYLSSSPRVTFALTRDLSAVLPNNSQIALSDTAKFLGSLLQKGAAGQAQAGQAGQAGQAARLAPVLNAAPASTADFAQSLRQAVSQSGLFYESHQVQWLSGERALSSLLQEPQGRLPPLPRAGAESAQTPLQNQAKAQSTAQPGQTLTQSPAQNLAQSQAPLSLSQSPAVNVKGQETLAQPASGQATSAIKAVSELVHPQATQLVQQQLHTLDSRQVVWQGQVWPGQNMHWEIEEESSRAGAEDIDEITRWRTRLNLQLPAMGGISAKLAFINGAVQLDISAERPDSAERMRSGQPTLSERFDASGLKLAGVVIRHEK